MEILKDKQLKQGDVIKWKMAINDVDPLFKRKQAVKLICMEIYPHHVLFRRADYTHMKVDIQNVELWFKGIYKDSDLLHPFARKVTT